MENIGDRKNIGEYSRSGVVSRCCANESVKGDCCRMNEHVAAIGENGNSKSGSYILPDRLVGSS